jgi:hypothetical protein
MSSLRIETKQVYIAAIFSWIFWGVLYGVWAFFFRSRDTSQRNKTSRHWQSFFSVIDMAAVIAVSQSFLLPQRMITWFVCAATTTKSFLRAQQQSRPQLLHILCIGVEFLTKLQLLKSLMRCSLDDFNTGLVTSLLTIAWLVWIVWNPTPTPCEVIKDNNNVADAVFLGHPAELSDFVSNPPALSFYFHLHLHQSYSICYALFCSGLCGFFLTPWKRGGNLHFGLNCYGRFTI